MSRIKGSGGSVNFGGALSYVTSFDFSESDAGVYGQKECSATVTVILDDTATPKRAGDRGNVTLVVSGAASWNIQITNARVVSASIPVKRDSAVTQTLDLKGTTTATIA